MPIFIYLYGIGLGYLEGTAVGPVGLMCLRRSITDGLMISLVSGLGATLANGVFGGIAAFGLTSFQKILLEYSTPFGIFGGTYLIYLGIKTFLKKPFNDQGAYRVMSPFEAFASTFLLTISNPLTIGAFALFFTTLNISTYTFCDSLFLVFGICTGSMMWWTTLALLGRVIRSRVEISTLQSINRFSGVLIGCFGVGAFVMSLLNWYKPI